MTEVDARLTGQTTDLLQALIRNACVNDGTPASGEEARNADTVDDALDGLHLDHYEPISGRRSVLATVEGSDPNAPTILLLGHTDVVPVSPDDWREDPFGGELIDGEVWGRGAVDMLNLTASMTVAVRHLATRDRPPRSTVKFLAVADEEAGGTWGAGWIAENAWDDVACDYVLTESGGVPFDGADGRKLVMASAEKGIGWRRLVVRRLADYEPRARINEHFRAWAATLPVDEATRAALLDPDTIQAALAGMDPRLSRYCHAVTHTTFSPNVAHGGTKTNTIPDRVELEVDIRTLPGVTDADVDVMLAEALGDLAGRVTIEDLITTRAATASPSDTPMFDLLRRRAAAVHPDAEVIPWMIVGGTDAAFFRERGVPSYGAGMFSPKASLQEFASRFHGHDERIDLDSLGLSTQLWIDLADGLEP